MKNASAEQVKKANLYRLFDEGVVYVADFFEVCRHYRKKVHVKRSVGGDLVLEDMEGDLHIPDGVVAALLLPTGPAQQPKRVRRKPVKGTKPETKIPFDEYVAKHGKLKVGDKVVVEWVNRCKWENPSDRQVVTESDGTTTPYRLGVGWFYTDGRSNIDDGSKITHVVLPWQAPAVEEKCQAQKDFEAGLWAGLWAGFVASSDPSCPALAKEERVEVFLVDGERGWSPDETGVRIGTDWTRLHTGDDCTIVAYRKAKQ